MGGPRPNRPTFCGPVWGGRPRRAVTSPEGAAVYVQFIYRAFTPPMRADKSAARGRAALPYAVQYDVCRLNQPAL